MKIISFIERRQHDVIEGILRHCGLWEGPIRTLANARSPPRTPRRAGAAASDLELVPDAEFLESQRRDGGPTVSCEVPTPSRELQLVLDPEFL